MRIAEIYQSRQGEGRLTGTESVFVRAAGCNLRCWFCDTPFTSWRPEGDDLAVDEILQRVADFACRHVVLTGGEPMLFAEMIPLCRSLRQADRHITIETAGTLYLPLECDLMSISPKLANSTPSPEMAPRWHDRHQRTRHAPEVIRRFFAEYPCQFKFVIGERCDLRDVQSYLEAFPEIPRGQVMLMPMGTERQQLQRIGRWLEPFCRQHGYVFCPRKHIEWYGFARGT